MSVIVPGGGEPAAGSEHVVDSPRFTSALAAHAVRRDDPSAARALEHRMSGWPSDPTSPLCWVLAPGPDHSNSAESAIAIPAGSFLILRHGSRKRLRTTYGDSYELCERGRQSEQPVAGGDGDGGAPILDAELAEDVGDRVASGMRYTGALCRIDASSIGDADQVRCLAHGVTNPRSRYGGIRV